MTADSRAAYLRAWHAAHPGRRAQYNREYRSRVAAYHRVSAGMRLRGAQRQRRRRMAEPDLNRVQQRMLHRGRPVTAHEARELIAEYGPLYPLHRGLNYEGHKAVRRMQSRGLGRVESVFEAWETPEWRLS